MIRSTPYLFLIFLIPLLSYAQNTTNDTLTYRAAEVVIVAGKTPATAPLIPRTVEIIHPNRIGYTLTSSTHDLLQSTSGLDAQSRGPAGIQTDLSMRGGTFEQTLVLVDGIPIHDPQTGHHTLDIPFNSDLIEQVEVLKGPGSRSYGSNALSGVVQFITRSKPIHSLQASVGVGEHGLLETSLSGGGNYEWYSHVLTFSHSKSDGYRTNTDFVNASAAYSGSAQLGTNKVSALIGYDEKKSGANGFYSSKFPSQFEKTRSLLVFIRDEIPTTNWFITPQLYYRRHNDDFVLMREDPAFYHNIHLTEVFGAEIHSRLESEWGTSMASVHGSLDRINSNKLGNHQRTELGASLEHLLRIGENLRFSFGTYIYNYDNWGWGATPGIDASYAVNNEQQIFLSVASSFRIPTYTELYYSDPNQQGNINLQPERGIAYEFGWRITKSDLRISAALFQHVLRDGIDWVKVTSADTKATATNLTKITAVGAEFSLTYTPIPGNTLLGITNLRAEYTYTKTQNNSAAVYQSFYLLTNLSNHAVLSGIHTIFPLMNFSWTVRHFERVTTGSATLVDVGGMYNIASSEIAILIGNLLGTRYAHFPYVPLPGQWITCKITATID